SACTAVLPTTPLTVARLSVPRSEEHTSELQSRGHLVCRLLLEKKNTTFSPNILHSGQKTNIVPDSAVMQIDIRTVPGDEGGKVREMLREAIGDLWEHVEIVDEDDNPASASRTDAPIFQVMRQVTRKVMNGAEIVPSFTVGATDSRFFRRKGVPAYGYSVYSANIPFGEFMTMFHGRNERIDQESLRLMLDLYEQTVREYLG